MILIQNLKFAGLDGLLEDLEDVREILLDVRQLLIAEGIGLDVVFFILDADAVDLLAATAEAAPAAPLVAAAGAVSGSEGDILAIGLAHSFDL